MNRDQRMEQGANRDERISAPSARSGGGLTKILIIVSVVLAFCGALVYAYNKGQRQNTAYVPPEITAPPGPVRVKPEDPGGMKVPGMAMEVLNNGSEPLTAEQKPPAAAAPEDKTPRKSPVRAEDPDISDAAETRTVVSPPAPEPDKPVILGKPQPKPPPPAKQPSSPVASPPVATSGTFYVQIASLRSEEAVRAEWSQMKSRHPDLLGRMSLSVERRRIEEKGVYYRMRVGPFRLRPDAQRFCDRLKARKQGCFVVRN